MEEIKPRTRGFASMDPDKRKDAQSKGGKKSHEKGVIKYFTSTTGKIASNKFWNKEKEHEDTTEPGQEMPKV